ncbi:flagellar hook-length control protein FliK [Allochromatium tepidum]|uniref:Flagellar hook-length control protein-like C-terminal domain-containing protein n=1 Tax=Allochromatium tepidum TaxID=553982 RepID=A0ABN6GJT7_9GAMM|nr:flagellar hook-length control protein FliK [Allochromatium tepidum]BCU08221.1 hypothetical protein Atep_28980 [Allochromatium tepidum]
MMQTTTMPTGLSGLLSQILGGLDESGVRLLGGSDGTGILGQADVGEFVQSLAEQIKSLMVERGADPVEVASIGDEALVAEFFALVQGQKEWPADGLSVATGLGGLMRGFEASAVSEEDGEGTEASPDDAPEQESEVPVWLTALPTVILERLSEAGRILPTPTTELAGPPASAPVDLETLTRALLRQSTPAAVQDAEQPEVPDTLKPTESASVLPAWLARQLSSDDARIWPNTAISAPPASNAAGDPASPSMGETLRSLAASGEHRLDAALDMETVLESKEATDLAPAGTLRTPTVASETTTGARLQTLDLNRLLQPGGEQRLAEQVRWSVDKGIETAEIKLHPPSLGALDVRLVQEGDKTHVQFVSAHPIAREVLEAAMPRLREALAQDGVLLGNVSVSDQAPQDRGRSGREAGDSTGVEDLETEDDEDRIESRGTISVLSRRLDVFT